MMIRIVFKANKKGGTTRAPLCIEGHIVYSDGEKAVTEIASNGARQNWNFKEDNIAWIECV